MKLQIQKIDVKSTHEGKMFPIFRDWDSIIPGYKPHMVYATTLNPNLTKGPILHEKRTGYMTAIGCHTTIEYLDNNVIREEKLCNESGDSFIIIIPAGIPIRIKNISENNISIIINLPDIAWHPENQDTLKFENWEECLNYVKK